MTVLDLECSLLQIEHGIAFLKSFKMILILIKACIICLGTHNSEQEERFKMESMMMVIKNDGLGY